MASLSCAHVDNTFGPHAIGCRGGFDFTLLFEESILSIAPIALLLILALFRILHLLKKRARVTPSPLLPLKLVCFNLSFRHLSLWMWSALRVDADKSVSLIKGLVYRLWSLTAGTCGAMGQAVGGQDTGVYPRGCTHTPRVSRPMSLVLC